MMGLVCDELTQRDRRVYLVLDDFHHLRDRAILALVDQTIWDESAPLRFILSAEAEPGIYLSPLRASGQLLEIDASALRLSTEEIHEVLARAAGAAISQDVVASVERQTEGWASAVNLSSLLIAGNALPLPFSRFAPTQHGYRRLVQELLSTFDSPTRELVIKSAFLPDLEQATIGRTLGMGRPPGIADWLAGGRLPVSRPAGYAGPVRYEPLFQATLKAEAELAMEPSDLVTLRCALAELSSERGAWEDAARFYLEAGRPGEAASAAEMGVERALEMGYLDSALRIVRAIPNGARASHPMLKVHEARPLIIRNQVDEARALLVSVRPELEALDDRRGLGMQLTRWVSLRLAEGRYEDARKLAVKGLDAAARRQHRGSCRAAAAYLAGAGAYGGAGTGICLGVRVAAAGTEPRQVAPGGILPATALLDRPASRPVGPVHRPGRAGRSLVAAARGRPAHRSDPGRRGCHLPPGVGVGAPGACHSPRRHWRLGQASGIPRPRWARIWPWPWATTCPASGRHPARASPRPWAWRRASHPGIWAGYRPTG